MSSTIYGLILENSRRSIVRFYGEAMWKRIRREIDLPLETFDLSKKYEEKLFFEICECLINIQQKGTIENLLKEFGENLIVFLIRSGFEKIIRVAGRNFRDFVLSIDQLHDSNRYKFPRMSSPLFLIDDENENGFKINYRSSRRGFSPFVQGCFIGVAKSLFSESIQIATIKNSISEKYVEFVFQVKFNNKHYRRRFLSNFWPRFDLGSSMIFRIFPFSIMFDRSFRILAVGQNLLKIFPNKSSIVGEDFTELFDLLRPEIKFDWNEIVSYGQNFLFLIENRPNNPTNHSFRFRLKGQMKFVDRNDFIWFLCHPADKVRNFSLESPEEMIATGFSLNDLNSFDKTIDRLIHSVEQGRAIEAAILKQKISVKKSEQTQNQLVEWQNQSRKLLYSIMPKHIALLLEIGIQPNCICESHRLITVLFVYLVDFKSLMNLVQPSLLITCLNNIIETFDEITDKYDVFKVETKADASYMIVAGLNDRLAINKQYEKQLDRNLQKLNQTETIGYLALDLLTASKKLINPLKNEGFDVKIGFHSGSAVGGIVGRKNLQYCLFGDTINTASRITMTAEIGQIHLSQSSYGQLISGKHFVIINRGYVQIKGKGKQSTYWLKSRLRKFSTSSQCPFSSHFLNESSVAQSSIADDEKSFE